MATQTKKRKPAKRSSSSGSSSGGSSAPASSSGSSVSKWPVKGGVGDQPWSKQDEDVSRELLKVLDGANKPILAAGSGGPEVRELGERLGVLGYANSISDGANPFNVFDPSLEVAVGAFCRDYDVQEDPTGFGGDNPVGRAQAAQHVGPWVWAAVVRASDRESGE